MACSVAYYSEYETHPDVWFLHPTAPEAGRIPGPNLKSGTEHLQFWAQTADKNFSIEGDHDYAVSHLYRGLKDIRPRSDGRHILWPLSLLDRDDYAAGILHIPASVVPTIERNPNCDVIALLKTKLSGQPCGEKHTDNIDDSEDVSMDFAQFPDEPSKAKVNDGCGFDRRRFDFHKPWCLYNIMLVEWKDGIAYRCGVGTCHIDAFAQAERKRRLITLG